MKTDIARYNTLRWGLSTLGCPECDLAGAVELADRYGKLPPPVDTLLKVAEIRIILSAAGYESMTVADGRAVIRRGNAVYRERDGRIPVVDPSNPAFLRLALVKRIAQDAAAARAGQPPEGRGAR